MDSPKMQEAQRDGESFSWSVRLSKHEPAKVAAVLAAALLAFLIGTVLFGRFLLGIAGVAIVLGATMEYLIGATYKLDAKGVSSRCAASLASMEWREVKRATASEKGILLSPFENPGTRDAFRGVFLRYGAENRERVLDAVRRLLPENVRLHEGGADRSGSGSPD